MPEVLPHELKTIIFKAAAYDDLKCALSLVRVAKYVRDMILPIIYEDIVLETAYAATCLSRTVRSYPYGHFQPKSILVSQFVPSATLDALFPAISTSVVKLCIYRNSSNEDSGLRSIQSTSISHLALVGQSKATGTLPIHLFPSITHLALVSRDQRQPMTKAIELADILRRNTTILGSILDGATSFLPPFRSLTHFACFTCFFGHYDEKFSPKLHMPALRCCAILQKRLEDEHSVGRIASLAKAWEDPRVVILEYSEDPARWYSTDDTDLSKFWAMVEELVAEHRFYGRRKWDESVIKKFRQENPQIRLLGY